MDVYAHPGSYQGSHQGEEFCNLEDLGHKALVDLDTACWEEGKLTEFLNSDSYGGCHGYQDYGNPQQQMLPPPAYPLSTPQYPSQSYHGYQQGHGYYDDRNYGNYGAEDAGSSSCRFSYSNFPW